MRASTQSFWTTMARRTVNWLRCLCAMRVLISVAAGGLLATLPEEGSLRSWLCEFPELVLCRSTKWRFLNLLEKLVITG